MIVIFLSNYFKILIMYFYTDLVYNVIYHLLYFSEFFIAHTGLFVYDPQHPRSSMPER